MSSPAARPEPWNSVVDPYERVLGPVFTRFATVALRRAELADGAHVLDVAAGPGTLALAAAPRCRVSALDFAPAMIGRLKARAAEMGVDVDARVGDGQVLPWPDATFDAAFSQFGLIFFPDPERALAELARVVRPGGRVSIGSWQPMDPRLAAMVEVLLERLGAPPGPTWPFGTAEDIAERFARAGLVAEIAGHTETVDYPSTEALLDALIASNAPMAGIRAMAGPEAWAGIEEAIRARVHAGWGDGPQTFAFDAWITVATKP